MRVFCMTGVLPTLAFLQRVTISGFAYCKNIISLDVDVRRGVGDSAVFARGSRLPQTDAVHLSRRHRKRHPP